MKRFFKNLHLFQKYIDQWWYPPLMSFIAAIDHFVFIFPIDAMIVSNVFIHPKKWKSMAIWFAVGSALGAVLIAILARHFGMTFVEYFFPAIPDTAAWKWAVEFFEVHGLWLVFLTAILPAPQQPTMIVVGFSQVSLIQIAIGLFIGRIIKFLIIAAVTALAPERLKNLWGIQGELHELDEIPTSQKLPPKPSNQNK